MTSDKTLVERLNAATMGFDWRDLPDDAPILAVPLLREAAAELTRLQSLASAAEPVALHGPFGWLNGHRALSEDSWTLESDPLESNEEYFAIPLFAKVDPFKEIGRNFVSPSASAGEVVVKALEWTEQAIPPTGECLAYSPVGLYCIPLGRAKFTVRFRDRDEDGPYETLADAKAAAQADYERRIRSALTAPPVTPAVEITEGMVARIKSRWAAMRKQGEPNDHALITAALAAALSGKG